MLPARRCQSTVQYSTVLYSTVPWRICHRHSGHLIIYSITPTLAHLSRGVWRPWYDIRIFILPSRPSIKVRIQAKARAAKRHQEMQQSQGCQTVSHCHCHHTHDQSNESSHPIERPRWWRHSANIYCFLLLSSRLAYFNVLFSGSVELGSYRTSDSRQPSAVSRQPSTVNRQP
jgi:hypothetical protein